MKPKSEQVEAAALAVCDDARERRIVRPSRLRELSDALALPADEPVSGVEEMREACAVAAETTPGNAAPQIRIAAKIRALPTPSPDPVARDWENMARQYHKTLSAILEDGADTEVTTGLVRSVLRFNPLPDKTARGGK